MTIMVETCCSFLTLHSPKISLAQRKYRKNSFFPILETRSVIQLVVKELTSRSQVHTYKPPLPIYNLFFFLLPEDMDTF